MTNEELRARLVLRRAELRERADHIASDLRRESEPTTLDADRAAQRENDDVLVSLGDAAHAEIARIESALTRLSEPGGLLCRQCARPIEPERLLAVPDADACATCASSA